jgi:hypothetical protein
MMLSTRAYLNNPTFGEQAKEDMKIWKEELYKLENN